METGNITVIHQRRKTTLIPNRAYVCSGALPVVAVTMPAAPWEDATRVDAMPSRLPNTGKARAVYIKGVRFSSLTRAAAELKIDKRTLMEAARDNRLDALLETLRKREATGQRPHTTVTKLFPYMARAAMI